MTSIGIIGTIIFLILAFLRMPIAIAMGVAGFIGIAYIISIKAAFEVLSGSIFVNFTSFDLTVCPLFILMGQILSNSGIGEKLFKSGYKIMGRVRGGLAMGTIVGCSFFAAACGSTIATAATMGTVALPEMLKYKYNKSLATATCASGGTLGILIPPSICFIIYGTITEQSIGKLFIAGVLPGIILSLLFMLSIYLLCLFNPSLAPLGRSSNLIEKLKAFKGIWEVLIIFVVIIGGLFAGIFTPVESASIGCLIALIFSIIEKRLTWKGLLNSLYGALRTSCMVIFIIATSGILCRFLALCKVPQDISNWMNALDIPSVFIMLIIMGVFLVATCFMETIPIMLIFVPIFLPIAVNRGYDPLWFGVIITVLCEMGLITPPVGLNIYTIKGVAKDVAMEDIFRGIWPFLISMAILLILLLIWPKIALYLPSFMTY